MVVRPGRDALWVVLDDDAKVVVMFSGAAAADAAADWSRRGFRVVTVAADAARAA